MSVEVVWEYFVFMIVGFVGFIDNDFVGFDMIIGVDIVLYCIVDVIDDFVFIVVSY